MALSIRKEKRFRWIGMTALILTLFRGIGF